MADTKGPASSRNEQAAQVADATVPDAKPGATRHADQQPIAPTREPGKNDRITSKDHPLSGEPLANVQHADRQPIESGVRNDRDVLPKDERERFEYLRNKEPNPNVLSVNVRTEEEEYEFRDLSEKIAEGERRVAMEAAMPDFHISPEERLKELKAKDHDLGEGETNELRRIEELMRDEKRIAELKRDDKRVPEEDEELLMLQRRATESRAALGFDANG